jgi:hypothetical protein
MTSFAAGRRVGHYRELIAAIEARRFGRGITSEALDAIAGLASGQSGRLLAHPNPDGNSRHRAGLFTVFLWLEALGLGMMLVEDPQALERYKARPSKDCRPRFPAKAGIVYEFPDFRIMRARKGGHARAAKLSPAKLSRIGRKGARARWAAVRSVQRI